MDEDIKSRAFQLLGNFIRKKRIEQNLTQEELGARVGYGEQTRRQAISQIERGNVSIPNKKLNLFIDELKLDNTFVTQVNYHLSKGEYAEAVRLLEDREELEYKIAVQLTPHEPIHPEEASGERQGTQAQLREAPETDGAEAIVNTVAEIAEEVEAAIETAEIKLSKLKVLFEKELITAEEFEMKRKEILDKYF